MGYRIMAKDIPVEVDTLEELQGVLGMLWALEGKAKHPGIPKEPPEMELPGISEIPTLTAQLSNYFRKLPEGNTRIILQALYDKPEGYTREELKKILNLDGPGFGGAMGSISNTIKRHGLKAEDAVSVPKEGKTHFRLTPAMHEAIRAERDRPKLQPLIRKEGSL